MVERVACSERTWMLLCAIRPSVVVCLGSEATGAFWVEPPPPWTWHTLDDGVVVGHARHPAYLLRVLATPIGEREYEAARRFYAVLRERMPALRKLAAWPLPLLYLGEAGRVMVGR